MANRVSNAQSESVKEEWRPVAGWEGFYEVSSHGRVRSLDRVVQYRCPCGKGHVDRQLKGRILSLSTGQGYPSLALARDGNSVTVMVHRLVCEAFHGPCPEGMEVAHNDGNSLNARADNLRWATPKENHWDKFRHGTLLRGKAAFNAKITDEDVQAVRRDPDRDPYEWADELGISVFHVRAIIGGRVWRHPTNEWDGEWLSKGERSPRWGLTPDQREYVIKNPDRVSAAVLAKKFGLTEKRIYSMRYRYNLSLR